MLRLRLALLALPLLAACAHPPSARTPAPDAPAPAPAPARTPAPDVLPGEEVLRRQPELPPLKPFDAPVPELTVLPNGLRLYVVERPNHGIEALELIIRRGSLADPPGKPGMASLTAAMLEAGSAGRSQTELAAAIDAIGAELQISANEDALTIAISAMPSRLDSMVGLLADVALRPNFDPAEWKRVKGHREAELIAARAQPVVAAALAFGYASYGAHPLGQPPQGTPASVKAMTLAQVKDFYRTFSPKEAALVAVGGAPAKDVVAALTRAFGGWTAGRTAPGVTRVLASSRIPAQRPRLVLVDFPGKPQAVLRVGQPAVPRSSPDFLALRVLNSVLGGSFTSRLNQNLREKHGYTYGAGSRFLFGLGPGPFFASSSVKTEVTGPALAQMLAELGRAADAPLSPDEVEKGKALLAYDLVQTLEHASTAAEAMGQIFLYDLPIDEYRRIVPDLKALTPEAIQAAAKRALAPGSMTIVVVGDAAKVEPQLAALKLPPPERRDAEGRPLGAR